MSISCKELLNIFEKIGGQLKVDYYTEKATLYPQNISCYLHTNNAEQLDKLVEGTFITPNYDYDEDGFNIGFYNLPLKNRYDEFKKIHSKQLSVGGFVIQFNRDTEGKAHPIKNFRKFIKVNSDE